MTEKCGHDLTEREVAVSADGYCPLCLAAENEQLRRALKHAAGILSDLEYHWFGPDFWPEIREALNIQQPSEGA